MKSLHAPTLATGSKFSGKHFWQPWRISHGHSSVPLAELYEGCREAVARRGGQVRLRCGVRQIRIRDGRFECAVLEDDSEVTADACIAAVPHNALLGLLPKEMGESGGALEGLRKIRRRPLRACIFGMTAR